MCLCSMNGQKVPTFAHFPTPLPPGCRGTVVHKRFPSLSVRPGMPKMRPEMLTTQDSPLQNRPVAGARRDTQPVRATPVPFIHAILHAYAMRGLCPDDALLTRKSRQKNCVTRTASSPPDRSSACRLTP